VIEAWKFGGYAPGGEEVRGYGGVEKSRATLLTLLIGTYEVAVEDRTKKGDGY
jgi:hypothetical protein